MDHYKILGVQSSASKEEIKQAFRNLAMQFHPDKHADSPQHLRDTTTVKFKQLSEAYEVLSDDRKRADYNICRYGASSSSSSSWNGGSYHNHRGGSAGGYGYGYTNNYGYTATRGKRAGPTIEFELLFRFLNARTFVRTATMACVLIGGIFLIDDGVDALWNTKNSGKSLEDALESIKESKAVKDKR